MKDKGFSVDLPASGRILKALKQEKSDDIVAKWNEFYQSMKLDNGEDGVVKDLVQVILGSDWSTEVENTMDKLKFPLKHEFLLKVIWNLKDEPLRALKFFEWIVSFWNFEHNSMTYSEMARVLAWRGFMDEFWDLVAQMRSKGFEIESYSRIKRYIGNEDAVKLFEFMMNGPYKLTEQDCVCLLRNLSDAPNPDMDLVTRVVNKYLEVGNTHTKAIYDNIYRCFCNLGRFDEAKKIVEDMRKAGYKPDSVTYSQEVFSLCKFQRFEDARVLLRQMETEGCLPDKSTWTRLIQGYCTADQVDQALSCFAQMLEKNIKPDGETLKVLINGSLSLGKKLSAYEFLVEVVNKAHLKPWGVTYKSMIEILLHDGKLEEAFNLLSMMQQQNYQPYSQPFILYISKSRTVEDAKRFLRALPMKGSISTAAYVEVISSFL